MARWLIRLMVAAVLTVSACGGQGTTLAPMTVRPDAQRATIRLTTSQDTVYYPVTGETTQEIFASMEANAPHAEVAAKDTFAAGLAVARPSYEYEAIDRGTYCELQSADISMRLVVTLPRHSNTLALSDLQLSRWQDYERGVAVHEKSHVDFHITRIEAFKRKMENLQEKFSDCDSLESSIVSAWELEQALNKREQDAFHLTEEQLSQSLIDPIQMQFDRNESELKQIQDKLDSISLEMDDLRLRIEDFGPSAEPYNAQIDAIRLSYPELKLPPDVFVEYAGLSAEWNRLNDLRNEMVGDLNDLVQSHNLLVAEFNWLSEENNALLEDLAWIP